VSRLALLYDAECPFCRAAAGLLLAWDRHHRLRPVALQHPEAERLLGDLTPAERLASVHAVRPGEAPRSGGAALGPLVGGLPGGPPLAAAMARFEALTERGYEAVAGNRERLSQLLPAMPVRRADALIRERS